MTNETGKKTFFRRYLYLYTIFVIGLITFGAGFFIGAEKVNRLSPEEAFPKLLDSITSKSDDTLDPVIFETVWERVQDKYVEQPVEQEALFYGAISGVVDGLGDPYSVYLPPKETADFKEELSGEFEGIGAEIGIKEDGLQVVAALKGTPAEKAGLRTGDLILQIDGLDTTKMTLDEAVSKIRGPRGTDVKLLIYHEPETQPREITIQRDTIVIESVISEIKNVNGKKIAYITITSFGEDTTTDFITEANTLLLNKLDGIVLDLRNNPGGYLNSSVDIASHWVSSGTIVYEQYSDGSRIPHEATGSAGFENIPTVVLINEGSASASEIVAGALQDFKKATLVGKKSFGKGSVQDFEEFRDGSSLKLTVARWITPNGKMIDGFGISPDKEVDFTVEDAEKGIDPQLDAALELLSTQ